MTNVNLWNQTKFKFSDNLFIEQLMTSDKYDSWIQEVRTESNISAPMLKMVGERAERCIFAILLLYCGYVPAAVEF